MLGLQLIRSEVKHQALSCSCYASIVLHAALKEETLEEEFPQVSGVSDTHTHTQQPECYCNRMWAYFNRNPEAATSRSPDPIQQ